jgi:hypothetical protein
MKMWKWAVLMFPGVLVMGCQSTCKTPTTVAYPPPGALVLPPQQGFIPPSVAPPPATERIVPVPAPLSAPIPEVPKQKTSGFEQKRQGRPDLMT